MNNGISSAKKETLLIKLPAYLQLILSDAVEGEVFVVDWTECSAEDASLDLVVFIW